MVAKKDPYIGNAAKTLYRASADDRVLALCEGRERGELTIRTLQFEAKQAKEQLQQQLQQQKQQYEEALQQQQEENARLRAELAALKQQHK